MKFDYCVSNPPYQESVATSSSNNTTINIYPLFYDSGLKIANNLAMIFPGGRWMQRGSRSNATANLIFSTVRAIEWFPNGHEKNVQKIFPNVLITDGISIVYYADNFIDNNIKLFDYTFPRPKDNEILPLQKNIIPVVLKTKNYSKIMNRKYKSLIFGLHTFYVERNINMVIPYNEGEVCPPNYIKAWLGNETVGSAKRVFPYWIKKEVISWDKITKKVYDNWKVVGTAGDISKGHNVTYKIIENKSVVGESWIIVGDFPTYDEACNYMNYLNSPLIKKLLEASIGGKIVSWGVFVPDLGDYSNNNPIFACNENLEKDHPYYGLSLNQRLYKFFNLSTNEIELLGENDNE